MSVTPPTIEQEMAMWIPLIHQNLVDTYVCMSTICFLSYDILINLDREVEHVWKARWSISKALFIFARYYGLMYICAIFAVTTTRGLSSHFCQGWVWVLVLAGDMPVATVLNVILAMRLNAMHQKKYTSQVVLISLVLCAFAIEMYVTIKVRIAASVVPIPPGIPMPGCLAIYSDLSLTLVPYVICLFIQTVFFVMTVVNTVTGKPKSLVDFRSFSPLIALLVRDGALTYLMLFVILLLNIIMVNFSQGLPIDGFMLTLWLVAIHSICACHLVLNLREAASQRTIVDTMTLPTRPQAITAPLFAANPMVQQGSNVETACCSTLESTHDVYPPNTSRSQ